MFQEGLFDVVEKLGTENREEKFNNKIECNYTCTINGIYFMLRIGNMATMRILRKKTNVQNKYRYYNFVHRMKYEDKHFFGTERQWTLKLFLLISVPNILSVG
jgi:hypothetical protein